MLASFRRIRLVLIILILVLLLGMLLLALYVKFAGAQSSFEHFLNSLLPIIAIAVVVIGVLFAVVLFWRGRQEIEVTESGLVTRFGGKVSKMDWNKEIYV